MAKKKRRAERLPKAPLVEVVFELRWNLKEGPPSQPQLRLDPGLLPLMEGFTAKMKKAGYGTFRDLSHPLETGGYGVARRYFKLPDKPFPIMQIGPGIFATNDDAEYSWNSFKAQIKVGIRALLDTYPKLGFFALSPHYLELRYVDAFNKSLLGKAAMFHFSNEATTLNFKLPALLDDRKIVEGEAGGRLAFQRNLKGWADSQVVLDMGSGKLLDSGEDIVRMETKVVTKQKGVPHLATPGRFISDVEKWCEFAHGITSPLFKQFIKPEVMEKFEGA
jgi:hypothetical protein